MAWPSYPAPPGSITSCESDSLLIKEKEEASDCDLQRGEHLTERKKFLLNIIFWVFLQPWRLQVSAKKVQSSLWLDLSFYFQASAPSPQSLIHGHLPTLTPPLRQATGRRRRVQFLSWTWSSLIPQGLANLLQWFLTSPMALELEDNFVSAWSRVWVSRREEAFWGPVASGSEVLRRPACTWFL